MVGTENPSSASAPEGGSTTGRRGAWLATDAPDALAWALSIVARDLDPAFNAEEIEFAVEAACEGVTRLRKMSTLPVIRPEG